MPINLGPHAIHGTGFTRPWEVEPDGALALELGPPWPFGGSVRHRVHTVDTDTITATLEVHADQQSMPAQAGWHPWFLRPVSLMFNPGAMYRRGDDGIPDGTLLRSLPALRGTTASPTSSSRWSWSVAPVSPACG